MSKISLSPSPTGSAVYTIASPAGSTDRTLTLPDAAGTVFVSGQALSATTGSFSGNVTLGSSVLETPTGSAPAYLCRAWVNFNGTTSPGTIRASGNVSSVTRLFAGRYQVNFATVMPDASYSAQVLATNGSFIGSDDQRRLISAPFGEYAASNFKFGTVNVENNAYVDSTTINVSIFR